MMTKGRAYVVDAGEHLRLDCQFFMETFNLFDNPVVWIKTQLGERTQMNMMGNLVEPFESTARFRVTFEARRPTFTLGLLVEGITAVVYWSAVGVLPPRLGAVTTLSGYIHVGVSSPRQSRPLALFRLARVRAFCDGRRVCRLSVCLSCVGYRKLSEIGAKFRRLCRKSGSPSKNMTSDFVPKVAKYQKSSPKSPNNPK